MPLYSCKFSKRTYTQHQLLILLLFKEYIGEDYRDIVELIEIMDRIKQQIALDQVPHYTTCQKFSSRIGPHILTKLLNRLSKLFYERGEQIPDTGIDSSGFTLSYASCYYSFRTNKTRKSFLKTSIAVDSSNHAVIGFKISRNPIHDVKHASPFLKQCHRFRWSQCYVLDKGYDSENLHELIHEDIGSDAMDPVRDRERKRIIGKYRRKMAKNVDRALYHRRNLVETTFSVLKRRFGECLKARKYRNQVKEIKMK